MFIVGLIVGTLVGAILTSAVVIAGKEADDEDLL